METSTTHFPDSLVIGTGQSGIVLKNTGTTVLKLPYPQRTENDISNERLVYERLGSHPRILHYHGPSPEGGLIFEYHAQGSLRKLIEGSRNKNATDSDRKQKEEFLEQNRLKWAIQLGEALVYLHKRGIIHCDTSSANILLTSPDNDMVLCDFAGSSIDNRKLFNPLAMGSTPRCARWYKFVGDLTLQYGVKEDIFALGSVLCEMWSGMRIWGDRTDEEKIALYREGAFPEVRHLVVGAIVARCWNDLYESVEQALVDLRELLPSCSCASLKEDVDVTERQGVLNPSCSFLDAVTVDNKYFVSTI